MHWIIDSTNPDEVLLLTLAVCGLADQIGQLCPDIPLYSLLVAIRAGYKAYLDMETEQQVNRAFYDNLSFVYHDGITVNLYQFFLTHMDQLMMISDLLDQYSKTKTAHQFVSSEIAGKSLNLSILVQ